jgi:sulfur relay (sulfurtransferase) DsrF/TusC family protein
MNSSALFVIDTDPRASGRPAEAVRIAAGVGVWKRIDVAVYLRDAAVLILGENTDELVDSENYTRYLPVLEELGGPIYVQKGASCLARLGQSALPFQEISDAALAQLAAERPQVIRF